MNPFSLTRSRDWQSAARELAGSPGARVIAGGTNLVDLIKYGVETPDRLVDVNRIPGQDVIVAEPDGGLRLGALATNSAVAWNEAVERDYPLLSSAILAGATPQLRNAATTGGNLNQRTRCYYFYEPETPCNKRNPGSGCSAIGGRNRVHAILGTSSACIATHPSDMCVALAALQAVVHVTGPQGERTIAFANYHRLPGAMPDRDNTLMPGEVVTAVVLPASSRAFARHHTYLKLRDRLSYAFALVSVAVGLDIEDGVIRQARIALGGVAHKPWRRRGAEEALEGRPAGAEAFDAAADVLLAGAEGQSDNGFKIPLARRAIHRALAQAVAGTPQVQTDKRIR